MGHPGSRRAAVFPRLHRDGAAERREIGGATDMMNGRQIGRHAHDSEPEQRQCAHNTDHEYRPATQLVHTVRPTPRFRRGTRAGAGLGCRPHEDPGSGTTLASARSETVPNSVVGHEADEAAPKRNGCTCRTTCTVTRSAVRMTSKVAPNGARALAAATAAVSPRAACRATPAALSMQRSCRVIMKTPQLSAANRAPAARVATANSAVTIPRSLLLRCIRDQRMINSTGLSLCRIRTCPPPPR